MKEGLVVIQELSVQSFGFDSYAPWKVIKLII